MTVRIAARRFGLAGMTRGAAILGAAIIAAGVCELVMRLAAPWHDPTQQLRFAEGVDRSPTLGPADRTLWNVSIADGWQTKVTFDRFGLRQAGDLRDGDRNGLFVVGDYFAFGWGVEERERFAELLAAALAIEVHDIAILGNLPQGNLKLVHYVESWGGAVRRLLIALPMETAVQRYPALPQAALPENEGDFPSPDRLAAAQVSRDQYRAMAGMWRVPYSSLPGSRTDNASSSVTKAKLWLLDHSALYRAAVRAAHSLRPIQTAAARLGLSEVRRPVQVNGEDSEAIRITIELLAQIADHYDLMIAVVPSPAAWIADTRDHERRRHARFVAALDLAGLSYCDLLPAFDDAGGIDALTYPRELYWNAAAHRTAAMVLRKAVASHWDIAAR